MDENRSIDEAVAEHLAHAKAATGNGELSRKERIAAGVSALVGTLKATNGRHPTLDETHAHAARLGITKRRETVHQHWKKGPAEAVVACAAADVGAHADADVIMKPEGRACIAAALVAVTGCLEHVLDRVQADWDADGLATERRHQAVLASLDVENGSRHAVLERELKESEAQLEAALADAEEEADKVAVLETRLEAVTSDLATAQAELRVREAQIAELASSEREARVEQSQAMRDAEIARDRAGEAARRCAGAEARLGATVAERDALRLDHARLQVRLEEVVRVLEAERARAVRQEETLRMSIVSAVSREKADEAAGGEPVSPPSKPAPQTHAQADRTGSD